MTDEVSYDVTVKVGVNMEPAEVYITLSSHDMIVTKTLCGSQARFVADLLNANADTIDPKTNGGYMA